MNHLTELPAVPQFTFFVLFINVNATPASLISACGFLFSFVSLPLPQHSRLTNLLSFCAVFEDSPEWAECFHGSSRCWCERPWVSGTGLRFARALTSVCHLSAPWPTLPCQDSKSVPRTLSYPTDTVSCQFPAPCLTPLTQSVVSSPRPVLPHWHSQLS